MVSGSDFNSSGKRIDALLKTRGIVESFCFAEIKTRKTELLKNVKTPYRPESWQYLKNLLARFPKCNVRFKNQLPTLPPKLK